LRVLAGADFVAWVAAALVLGFALRSLRWTQLADAESAAVFVLVLLAMIALRLVGLSLGVGEELHFTGAAIATLMFGWRYALLASALATAADAALSGAAWIGLPWSFLCTGVLPVTATWWLLAATRKVLPRNPFAYFLGAAFGGGLLGAGVLQVSRAAVLLALGLGSAESLTTHYLLTLPAMMFGEGFLTGGALAILATWKPAWVATFDDDFYLRGGPPT
jgi:uncharacterized membrane protein